jgi:hypothetical protein
MTATYKLVPLDGGTGTQLVDGYDAARKIAQDIANRERAEVIVTNERTGEQKPSAKPEPWTFNGDYADLAQVLPYIDRYWELCAEFTAAGHRTLYHSLFYGRIPGLEGALKMSGARSGPEAGQLIESPETPIYLLAQLRHLVEGHDLMADTLAAGYERITELPGEEPVKFASVAVFDCHLHRTIYAGARLVPLTDEAARRVPGVTGRIAGVLPKGKQTRGRTFYTGETVYVLGGPER